MKIIASALLVASAAAFAPAQTGRASTCLNVDEATTSLNVDEASTSFTVDEAATSLTVDATKAIGVQAPLGYYDPLNIFEDPENVDQEQFDRLRYTELKHGRVSMLAVVGYLVTYAGIRFPGAGDVPAGFAALNEIPGMVWAQMLFTVYVMEMANGKLTREGKDITGTQEFPGDFRNGYIDYGWDKKSDEWKLKKRAIELNNGRAAMMGILGLMVHDLMGNVDEILPWGQ